MKHANILVVEDDASIQQLVSYNLIKAGFHVTCADSGEEALDFLLEEKIDCVLLDLMLPGMSGYAVCQGHLRPQLDSGGLFVVVLELDRIVRVRELVVEAATLVATRSA